MLRFAVIFGLASLAAACGSRSSKSPSDSDNVFGRDNREMIESREYPWSAIGRLDSGCTGTLVGRRLVLTAAHCVVDNATGQIKPELTYFRPNMIHGESETQSFVDYVWYGSATPEDDREHDWAVLRLTDAVGDTYKWLPVASVDVASALPYSISVAGYSVDRSSGDTASVHRDCYIHHVNGFRMLHDCDAASGVSGGPVIVVRDTRPTIIGITVSEYRGGASESVTRDAYSDDYANVAIGASGFAIVIDKLRLTVDVGGEPTTLDGVIQGANPNVPGGGGTGHTLPDPGGNDSTPGNGNPGNGNPGNGNPGNGNPGNGNPGNGNPGNGNGNPGNGTPVIQLPAVQQQASDIIQAINTSIGQLDQIVAYCDRQYGRDRALVQSTDAVYGLLRQIAQVVDGYGLRGGSSSGVLEALTRLDSDLSDATQDAMQRLSTRSQSFGDQRLDTASQNFAASVQAVQTLLYGAATTRR
jgi:V8-like Glu-specific endopeptidase